GIVSGWPRDFVTDRALKLGFTTAELILDVNADDVIERLLGGGEGELERAVGDEVARPARDDADDGRIGHTLDARGDVLAGDAIDRGDLFADGHRHAGHAEIAPRPRSEERRV